VKIKDEEYTSLYLLCQGMNEKKLVFLVFARLYKKYVFQTLYNLEIDIKNLCKLLKEDTYAL
jgi:hypothetical protein